MPAKLAPPPPVAPETWRALLAAAAEFAALKPWAFACDNDSVGLIDPVTGETRIGHVLGNAGEVFAAVFYRRGGLRWILTMFSDSPDPENLNHLDGMDCLKLGFVPKRELWKEDLALLKAAGFKPVGRGPGWPQFRSTEPGWHPWHLNQAEADQLLADLPRLTAFCRLFAEHPNLYEGRGATEIPFLPAAMPDRPLTPGDLGWRPLLPPPSTALEPFQAGGADLERLRGLRRAPELAYEFDCTLLPGGSFVENGRPCFGRFSLLVEKQSGLIAGMEVASGGLTPGEAAGRALVKTLLMGKTLPKKLFISGSRLQPVLQPLCNELGIELWPVSSLPALQEAVESLSEWMAGPGLAC
ncbi:MAG TPA: hypothetical protein PLT00_06925 [Verrucomicrobiota bacterium]|nr:hypothetical protein [Verrucomicrobiota bacterium]HQB16430.1 hypothetical protein [Verrucomicrobiota bacterium]